MKSKGIVLGISLGLCALSLWLMFTELPGMDREGMRLLVSFMFGSSAVATIVIIKEATQGYKNRE